MISVEDVTFSGFLGMKEIKETYGVTEETIQNLVRERRLKTYCTPSDEKVFSKKDLERELT